MSLDAYNSIPFTGTYRHGVDSKNRMTIPADWRSGEEGLLYVRLHSTGTHAIAMSPRMLEQRIAELETAEGTAGQRSTWVRLFASSAQRCCVDKQGRMVLPPELCQKAGLKGEVLLLGAMKEFQLWNTERWAAQQAAEEAGNQDLANLLGI